MFGTGAAGEKRGSCVLSLIEGSCAALLTIKETVIAQLLGRGGWAAVACTGIDSRLKAYLSGGSCGWACACHCGLMACIHR